MQFDASFNRVYNEVFENKFESEFEASIHSLQVGQWVQFETTEDLSHFTPHVRYTYGKEQYFLVFSREDDFAQICRCNIMDLNKKIHDYIPDRRIIGETRMVKGTVIQVLSREEVESTYGKERVQAIYEAAKNENNRCASYYALYGGKLLKD